MRELAEVLLRGPSTLSRGEREVLAAVVSRGDGCEFCADSHAAVAAVELGVPDPEHKPWTAKMVALVALARKVRESGLAVRAYHFEDARAAGASDMEIHDTVLIAAAFSMFTRYVDGLGTPAPADPADYVNTATEISKHGYAPARRSGSRDL